MAERFLRLFRFGRAEEDDNEASDSDEIDDAPSISDSTTRIQNITFDKSLPSTHEYLGGDLEDVQGRTIHDDDSYLSLPLLSLYGVVLMPGQTLPLHLFQPRDVAMIRHVLDKDKTFGQITERYDSDGGYSLASVGTTAEVLAFKDDRDERSGISNAKIKAIGRQRFQIIETHRQIDGILMGKVRILTERVLDAPLDGATPQAYRRLTAKTSTGCPSDLMTSPGSLTSATDLNTTVVHQPHKIQHRHLKVNHLSAAIHTYWPSWVYRQYDPQYLMSRIHDELNSWNESFDLASHPHDPVEFSFWVARLMPLDDSMKLQILQTDNAIQRLRFELSIMKQCTVLCCSQCSQQIANKNEVFSMSVEGPLGAYVNPQGHVHETMTLLKAGGLSLRGRPSTESSWFPGYAWTIAECKHCHSHMGWKFTVAPGNSHLKPNMFWGLCRVSLSPKLVSEQYDMDPLSTPTGQSPSVLSLT